MNFNMTNTTLGLYDYNETCPDVYRRPFSMRVLGSVFLLFLGVAAVVGNTAVVFASYWNERLRSQANNLLLVYLSITDAITGLFAIIPTAIAVGVDYWPFGDNLCKLQNGIAYSGSCSSSFNISFISVDRALAVLRPLQYHNIMYRTRITYLCTFLFLLQMSILLPALILNWSHYSYNDGVCMFDWSIPETRRFTSAWTLVSCYYIPALCMFICNFLIIAAAQKKKRTMLFVRRKGTTAIVPSDSNMNKTITSVVVLVVTYCASLAPSIISRNLALSIEGFTSPPQFDLLAIMLICASSVVNPFIYGIFRKDYRMTYKKMAQKLYTLLFGWD